MRRSAPASRALPSASGKPGRFAFGCSSASAYSPSPPLGIETVNHGGSPRKATNQMIIRAQTFRSWFNANLKSSARDIAHHGADCGFPGITYTSDTVKLFDRFGDEIWDMAVEDAEQPGSKNVADMIANFRRSDMLADLSNFKNLMVWFACETLARELDE
jgi:hypothetical protein